MLEDAKKLMQINYPHIETTTNSVYCFILLLILLRFMKPNIQQKE